MKQISYTLFFVINVIVAARYPGSRIQNNSDPKKIVVVNESDQNWVLHVKLPCVTTGMGNTFFVPLSHNIKAKDTYVVVLSKVINNYVDRDPLLIDGASVSYVSVAPFCSYKRDVKNKVYVPLNGDVAITIDQSGAVTTAPLTH